MAHANRISARDQVTANGGDGFRMTFTINGTAYRVRRATVTDGEGIVKAFGLANDKLEDWCYVAQRLTGNTCNCAAFRDNATCQHVRAMVAVGLLDDGIRPNHTLPESSPDATLADKADREASAYRALGTPEGDLFARSMDELALKIRMTQATTPDEYEGRIEVLDGDIRERWEARGYEEGRRSGCHCGENTVD